MQQKIKNKWQEGQHVTFKNLPNKIYRITKIRTYQNTKKIYGYCINAEDSFCITNDMNMQHYNTQGQLHLTQNFLLLQTFPVPILVYL